MKIKDLVDEEFLVESSSNNKFIQMFAVSNNRYNADDEYITLLMRFD